MSPDQYVLLRLSWSESGLLFQVNGWLIALTAVAVVAVLFIGRSRWLPFRKYDVVEVDVPLGNVGHAKLKPNTKDLQIAHQIWNELVTRKAAIPIDPDRDVISEVYDSWYQLFQRIRVLIAEVPADLLRRDASTRELVRIAVQTLNEGLRPHLTRWQAEFRNWMKHREVELQQKSPQEVQRGFPHYQDLVAEMRLVNQGLRVYADALEKIA